jgi:hypothetical protein
MLVIGSTAIKHNYPDFPRTPSDLDYIVEDSSAHQKQKDIEFLENPILFKMQSEGFIDMDTLLSLKISHMFWDLNWDKHMFDIQFLLKKGHTFDLGLVNLFRDYWEETKPKIRRSKLVMTKEDFFNNAVNEDTNEHDYLHTIINPIPMYTRLLKEGCEVELDESKWVALSFEDKCAVVFEETAVMAWERYKDIDYRAAYKRQLKDNIIKHFPPYIAIFAIENYIKVERPIFNFKTKIDNELQLN